jgi:CheY-like chemotaxis protein
LEKPLQRLLLIEDHIPLARMTAELLREAGLEVRIAISAEEALRVAAVFLPEIVLCDMFLPDMSGIEVARALRARPEMKNVFFGIHTGIDVLRLEDIVSSAEINMILPKPLTPAKIDVLLAESAKLRRNIAPELA